MSANWIRRNKRIRIYERDGWKCIWCTCQVVTKHKRANFFRGATLDHFLPRCMGGGNEPTNLVTSCKRCNDRRGATEVERWATPEGLQRAQKAIATPL